MKTPDAPPYSSPVDIPELTGLRGVAAGIVFVSHAANRGFGFEVLGSGLGRIGVALFFILSGFLMAYLYLRRDFRSNVGGYAASRVARVFPLYIAVVLLSWTTSRFGVELLYFVSNENLVRSLLFITSASVLWSIPTEVQFYVVFCLFWAVFSRLGPRGGFAFLGGTCALFLAVTLAIMARRPETPAKLVLWWSHVFAIGIVFGYFYDVILVAVRRFYGRFRPLVLPLAVCLLLVTIPGVRRWLGLPSSDAWADPVALVSMAMLFWLVQVEPMLKRALSHRVALWLGTVSFSFYVLHEAIILHVLGWLGPVEGADAVLGFGLALAITAGAAQLSYRWLESPARAGLRPGLKRRFDAVTARRSA